MKASLRITGEFCQDEQLGMIMIMIMMVYGRRSALSGYGGRKRRKR